MTDIQRIDPTTVLSEQLATASPDLLRGLLSSFIQALMSAEADTACGAGYGERSEEHREPDVGLSEIVVAVGPHPVAFGVRSSRHRISCCPI
jgi:hypothetical protein